MTKSFRLIPFALVATAAIALAGTAGFTLKRTPKEGETLTYNLKADVDFNGMNITFTGKVKEKTTKVDSDGSYTVESQTQDAKINMNGQEMDAPGSDSVTTSIYTAEGLTKEIKGDSASDSAYRMSNLGALVTPGKEINVGDTWTHEFKADAKTGVVAAKAEYKLLGEEKIGDIDTLKIKVNITETEGSTPASSDGTAWVSKADGSTVKLEAKWTNAPFPGAPAPINANVTLTRA